MNTLPANLTAYSRTRLFDRDSIPLGLRNRHQMAGASWGQVVVVEGSLTLRFFEPPEERTLDPRTPGVLPPGRPHEVEAAGPVRFFVEFYGEEPMSRPEPTGPQPIRAEPSSPVCFAGAANDAYMGYADTAELLAFLNELLEAERAGAKVALETARAATRPEVATLMEGVRHDEARWCTMLLRHIRRLGGPASPNIGAFHDKAMAIADIDARIAFLNRGQGWVVRKLREMRPRVRDDALHADLDEMLGSHVDNIARAAAVIAAPA